MSNICPTCQKEFTKGFRKRKRDSVETQNPRQRFCSKKCAQTHALKFGQIIPAERLRRLLTGAKYRAKEKSLHFNLTKEYLLTLWEETDGRCLLTGRPFILDTFDTNMAHPSAPSLDRIIPALGYVEGNVRLICYHLNIALSNFGEKEFKLLIRDYIATQSEVA